MNLLKDQRRVAKENFDKRIFLEGIAGTGKSTAAIERIKQLIRDGAAPDSILLLVPQSAVALPYQEALRRSRVEMASGVRSLTLGSLAFFMTDLFWPLIAEEAGFENPFRRPHFLTLELVQYYMTRFVEPEIERRDWFNSVHISRSRLYTQVVDNLNKAAVVGFDHNRIAERLESAWRGDVEQKAIYGDAQNAASLFREICLKYNLLDFSLEVEIFLGRLWPREEVRRYLARQYRHLIVDNIEEDTPATHDMLRDWLPLCESALLIYDSDAGYRRFLGADPVDGYALKDLCEVQITLSNHRVMSPDMEHLQLEISRSLDQPLPEGKIKDGDARDAIIYSDNRYHPQMMDWTAEQIASLVHDQGVSPREIVVLAPYLPDALRFSLQTRLDELHVPVRTHRPSRALREEPAARTLLTLAKLAHPQWAMAPSTYDVAYALTSAISEMDLVRARLLTDVLYRGGELSPFEQITNEATQQRITFELGMRYETLRLWLHIYQTEGAETIDVFFSRLFGEVLSQPQFGFHQSYDAANTCANLIDSAREFRQIVGRVEPELDTAREYAAMVDRGVIANQYIRDWELHKSDAVLLAPAYTFLMSNQPVDYQFWLNVGSSGWSQRLYQPLTHPYVLSRQWEEGRVWTDMDEYAANQETLSKLALGLIRRCRKQIYLGLSEYNEQGFDQRGPLLMAIQHMLQRLWKEGGDVPAAS